MDLIGECEDQSFIILKNNLKRPTQDHSLYEIFRYFPYRKPEDSIELLLKTKLEKNTKISQASLQQIYEGPSSTQTLLTLVYKTRLKRDIYEKSSEKNIEFSYSAKLFLLENLFKHLENASTKKFASIIVLEEIEIVERQDKELRTYVLPATPTLKNSKYESTLSINSFASPTSVSTYRNQIIALTLNQCITIYNIEATCSSMASAKIEILSSEVLCKNFWWAQWIPSHNFIAFIAQQRKKSSSIEEEVSRSQSTDNNDFSKPVLTVFQFHSTLPRETVLNMPMMVLTATERDHKEIKIKFPPKPTVLSSSYEGIGQGEDLRLLANSSGEIYLLYLINNFSYQVNILHHNKTLSVCLKNEQQVPKISCIEAILLHSGQFIALIGYSKFVHVLDVGIGHEPSHHLFIDLNNTHIFEIPFRLPVPNEYSFIVSTNALHPSQLLFTLLSENENDLKKSKNKIEFEINSQLLIPLLKLQKDSYFLISVIHYLLVHQCDVNASKKIIYEACKNLFNPHLTQLFQEFLSAHTFLLTKKQLLKNMSPFLHLVPYSSITHKCMDEIDTGIYTIKVSVNSAKVSSMLLSPNQRILPHSECDLWTRLYEISESMSKSNRFQQREIAQKLILSLQCYQPEAMSRATTPMSPSSPMVCNSLGDIAALFGRKTSELQLPFIEHESCTANKQEYVYSIYLRELSMHLLKERRDWPLHGQTVSGKYMNSLVDTARLLCHLISLTLQMQPTKNKHKGFSLLDALSWEFRLKLFVLFEHYAIALGALGCPLPQGFTPFFAYLGYRVLKFDQFLWHVRSGAFDLQIDLVKRIMIDLRDNDEGAVSMKLQLISLLPKSRGTRILNTWSHHKAISIRARQHSSDLLSGSTSVAKKSTFYSHNSSRVKMKDSKGKEHPISPLDTFLLLLSAKANVQDIDLGLLAEATMLSMKLND